ncbi:MAG TPA: hypothetical protein VHR66_01700 [Gemmataceae bacterium]|jgi:hypothetical protein|nr:hypothetical protein [Gemmataceae bacterium]
MLTSVALFAALTLTPSQGGGLNLSNPRITYGELGSTRPDNKLLPGDIFFLSFDIEGIKVSDTGRVKYSMAMEVFDSTAKSIFKQPAVERPDDFVPLGGTKLPARAFVSVGPDQAAGIYTCKVTVTDLSDPAKPVAKSLDQKFEVLPKGFGIVQLYTAADQKGEIAAPLVGVSGQALFVHFAVVDFARDPGTKQPSISIEMVVYDKDKQPTLVKPTVKNIPDEVDGKVDEKLVGVPMRFLVPLNREGGFLIQLKATDNISKKSSIVYLPLRVFPAGN